MNQSVPISVSPRLFGPKARAYARLGKLHFFDYYLSAFVVWTLLPSSERWSVRALGTLAAFLVSEVCLIVATVSFDDVTGYRDGSDAINYGSDARARPTLKKPLLTGALTPAEAMRFGGMAAGLGVLLWALSLGLAPQRPVWVVVLAVVYLVLSVQYSWGMKISYHGGQEIYIAGLGVALVIVPFGLLTGSAPGLVIAEALLLGLGQILIGAYSNIHDIAGDSSVNRPTLAAILSPSQHNVFVGALSIGEVAVIVAPAALGLVPWWFSVVMAPVVALRAVQFGSGIVRQDILVARRQGIRTFRVSMGLLMALNIGLSLAQGHLS